MKNPCTAAAVIAEARKWIGYLEKKSGEKLDSFTANAGSRNYTRFNRDLIGYKQGIGAQPMEWCGAFVSCVFVYAFGLEAALRLLCGALYCYTPSGAAAFRRAGRYVKRGQGRPKPGDVVFFYSSTKGRIGHTGIVEKVSGNYVYTIEGNTSGGSSLVTNGGGVAAKKYALTSSYIDGYGRPDYAGAGTNIEVKALEPGDRLLVNGMEGDDVKALQKALIRLGFSCGSWGADGDFGDATEMAVRAFQRAYGCAVDGEYGPESHAAMVKAIDRLDRAEAAQAADGRYVETLPGMTTYIRAAPWGKILGVLQAGERLPYGGQTDVNGWRLIEYKGGNACVSGKYTRIVK